MLAAGAAALSHSPLIAALYPRLKELFFDDDTFTDDRRRAEEIARGLARLGLTWSCNAKANVPYETPYPGTELYRQAKENGWLPPDSGGASLVSESGTQLAAGRPAAARGP